MQTIDLTCGEVQVIGNEGDSHTFRVSNPADQELISEAGQYEAVFETSLGNATEVSVNDTDKATGILTFPVVIAGGKYILRLLNPRRTILVVEVESR